MEDEKAYFVIFTQEICNSNNRPCVPSVSSALKNRFHKLEITTQIVITNQADIDLLCIFSVVQSDYSFIKELKIHNQYFSTETTRLLCTALLSNKNITNLNLQYNNLSSSESISYICSLLNSNHSIQVLDLSYNSLSDVSIQPLCVILSEIKLKALLLDHNDIKNAPLCQGLSYNLYIEEFSISFNPLSFETVSNVLETLLINKRLKTLGVMGIELDGPAPIKENQSGQLTTREAVLFKLAQVLRYSNLIAIAIDIDPNDKFSLEELECTLVKHNRVLKQIISRNVNWQKIETGSPLIRILRALKANARINLSYSVPEYMHNEYYNNFEDSGVAEISMRSKSPDLQRSYDSKDFTIPKLEELVPNTVPKTPQFPISNTKIKFDHTESETLLRPLIRESIKDEASFNLTDTTYETPLMESPRLDESMKNSSLMGYFQTILSKMEKFEEKFDVLSLKIENVESKIAKQSKDLGNQREEMVKAIENVQEECKKNERSLKENMKKLNERLESLENKQVISNSKKESKVSEDTIISHEISKLESQLDIEDKYTKIKYSQEKWKSDIRQRLLNLEIRENDSNKQFKKLSESLNSEISQKFTYFENKMSKIYEIDREKDSILYSINNLERRMHCLDEKLSKEVSNIKEALPTETSEQNTDVYYTGTQESETKRGYIKPMILKTPEKAPNSLRESFTYRSRSTRKPYKSKGFESNSAQKSLKVRKIEDIDENDPENLRNSALRDSSETFVKYSEKFHHKTTQSPEKNTILSSCDLGDYFPSEAESIVLNAMLERVNKTRKSSNLRQSSRGLSPSSSTYRSVSHSKQASSDYGDYLPSQEVQESLKQRGFIITDNKSIVRH